MQGAVGQKTDPYSAAVVVDRTDGLGAADPSRGVIESLTDGVAILDSAGCIAYLNDSGGRILRQTPVDAIGRDMHDVLRNVVPRGRGHRPESCALCTCAQTGAGQLDQHNVFWRWDGSSFPAQYSLYAHETGGLIVLFRNHYDRKVHPQDLPYIMASAKCLLWYGEVQYIPEKNLLRWFLWPPDESAALNYLPIEVKPGQTFADAFAASRLPEDRPRTDAYGMQEVMAGRSYSQSYRCRMADGSIHWLREDVQVEKVAEDRWRAAGVCTDITELKQREAEIEALNEQLRRSMVETHHRVKNNLQVIAAMIDLQTMDQPEWLPLSEFTRLGQHVRALATVHDLLTHEAKSGGQADCVSARCILERLLPALQQLAPGRRVCHDLGDTLLRSRQATSLAIITNELVSNALKHAPGDVHVDFWASQDWAVLSVSDSGSGFPPGFDPAAAAHTGLELVSNLTRWDLQGSIEFGTRTDGTGARATVRFPVTTPDTRDS